MCGGDVLLGIIFYFLTYIGTAIWHRRNRLTEEFEIGVNRIASLLSDLICTESPSVFCGWQRFG